MTDSHLQQFLQFLQLARPAQLAELAPLAATALLMVILMLRRCAPALRRRDGGTCSLCLSLTLVPLFFAGLACGMPPPIAGLNAATTTAILALGTLVLGARPRRRTHADASAGAGRRWTDAPMPPRESRAPEHAHAARVTRFRGDAECSRHVSAETRTGVHPGRDSAAGWQPPLDGTQAARFRRRRFRGDATIR